MISDKTDRPTPTPISDPRPDPPSTISASILVPVLDEAEGIRASVAAMLAQRLDGSGSIEVLVADGGSRDGTRELLEAMADDDPRVIVLENPRRGTASGLNVCLAAARGTFVARMDAHTTYGPDYVAVGARRLEAADTTWVSGPQLPVGSNDVSRAVEAALGTWLGRGGSGKWSLGSTESELDTGVFCGVWRRADLLRHGGWDEGWPRNQDSEMAARFLRAGERIVSLPTMAAQYEPRGSLRGLWRQYHDYGVYRARTALRHPTSLRRSAVLPPGLVVAGSLALLAPARPLRIASRGLCAVYVAMLVRSMRQGSRAEPPVRARHVGAVLATMHVAHGTGFLRGAGRWGPPVRGLLRLVGVRRAQDEGPFVGPVHAPSLGHADGP